MTSPAYHLRPNKAADRFALIEAIRRLSLGSETEAWERTHITVWVDLTSKTFACCMNSVLRLEWFRSRMKRRLLSAKSFIALAVPYNLSTTLCLHL